MSSLGTSALQGREHVSNDEDRLVVRNDAVSTPLIFFLGSPASQPFLKICFDPPRIEISEGVEWDAVARKFWNIVAQQVGQAKLFPYEPDR